ncbi:YbfB/YjiJ family MFS transporter [Tistrella bauzanensis]
MEQGRHRAGDTAARLQRSWPAAAGGDAPVSLRRDYLLALGLSLGPAASNGLARFAFALILPAMRSDLSWSYTQAGWVNTTNAIGYLLGAFVTLRAIDRAGARTLLNTGMVMSALALVLSGMTSHYPTLLGLRAVAGVGGAFVFISVVRWQPGSAMATGGARRPRSRSIFRGRSGDCRVGRRAALAVRQPGQWCLGYGLDRSGPVVLCGLPRHLGGGAGHCAAAAAGDARVLVDPSFAWLAAGYVLFAFGYIGYMTFIIAHMSEAGASPGNVALVWVVLGVVTALSHRIWRHALAGWSGGTPMAATVLVVAVGASLPLIDTSLPVMLLSAALFGSAFFITPAAATAFLRQSLPQEAWGRAIAVFTLLFAFGQTLGPVVAGWLADATGRLSIGLAASAVALLLGALVSKNQPLVIK